MAQQDPTKTEAGLEAVEVSFSAARTGADFLKGNWLYPPLERWLCDGDNCGRHFFLIKCVREKFLKCQYCGETYYFQSLLLEQPFNL